jgi:hypothetical protein
MLLVGLDSGFTSTFIDYSVGLAGRLGYDVLALSIVHQQDGGRPGRRGLASVLGCLAGRGDRIGKALESCGLLGRRTREAKLLFGHIVACGPGQTLIQDTCRAIRGIEFAIVQKTSRSALDLDFTLPAYLVEC